MIAQGLIRTTDGKRAAFHDILINTDACKDYIQGALDDVEEIMERSGFDGMVTTNQSLQTLVEEGRVEANQAIAMSLKPNELARAAWSRWDLIRTTHLVNSRPPRKSSEIAFRRVHPRNNNHSGTSGTM